jgi:hypothetical protein
MLPVRTDSRIFRLCCPPLLLLLLPLVFCSVADAANSKAGDKASTDSSSTAPAPAIPIRGETPVLKEIKLELVKPLSDAYWSGNWTGVQSALEEILRSINGDTDPKADFSVLFVSAPDEKTPVAPIRVVYTKRPEDPFATRLFGPTVYDIQIMNDPRFEVHSQYSAQRTPNPAAGLLTKIVSTFVGGFPKGWSGTLSSVDMLKGSSRERPATVSVTVRKLLSGTQCTTGALTINRATLQIVDTMTEKDDAFKDRKDKAAKEKAPAPDSKQTATLTTPYNLAPLTTVTFGLAAGVVAHTNFNTPVNTPSDATKPLTPDNLNGLLTLIAVNWHPIHHGFNEALYSESLSERFRVIAPALIMTPNPGIGAGAGFELARGLGLVGGYGVILTPVLRSDDTLGVTSNTPSNPTRRGALGVVFIGVEYSLSQ